MWQRYNDCVICDCKSIPNVQGLVIDPKNRNMIVAFNKVLHIWRYEKSDHILRDSVDEAYNNCNSWYFSGPKAQGIDQFSASAFGGPYSFSALSSHYTPTKEV